MESFKVSIIVPVYNTEPFLEKCIDSVIAQKFRSWELLLVDDGSSDASANVCRRYTLMDNRIKYYYKENSGVSDTRNYGLNIAQGKYIMFLDSDDYWIDSDILLNLVSLAEKENFDIVRGEYKEVTSNGDDLRIPDYNKKIKFEGKNLSSVDFLTNIIVGEFFLVLSLIKKDCIKKLRFNTKRIFLEDAEFYLNLLQQPLKCTYLSDVFYAYRKHSNSVTVKFIPGNKKIIDAFDFTRLCFNLSKHSKDHNMTNYLVNKGLSNYFFDVFIIAESESLYKHRHQIFYEWGLYDLHKEVKSIIKQNGLFSKYKSSLLPLSVVVIYFRCKLVLKLHLKNIFNKVYK